MNSSRTPDSRISRHPFSPRMARPLVVIGSLAFAVSTLMPSPTLAAEPWQANERCLFAPSPGALPPDRSRAETERTLCQNLDDAQRLEFWFQPQGSQIVPYSWFLSLEHPRTPGRMLADPETLNGLRYLPQDATEPWNPGGLPIGFTRDEFSRDVNGELIDRDDGKPDAFQPFVSEEYLKRDLPTAWLGFNCSACHTGQVEYGGTRLLIDGAPAMANFEGFMSLLVESMEATLCERMDGQSYEPRDGKPFEPCDRQRFDRFADRLRSKHAVDVKADTLRDQLRYMANIRWKWNERNRGANPYGYARLDAIGSIFNEIAATALGIKENAHHADAPVSYPFTWDTPRYDFVQWNGSVRNARAGALGRNVGEVLGVFGSLKLNTRKLGTILKPGQFIEGLRAKGRGHETSVNVPGLATLEDLLWKLRAPDWPDAFFKARADAEKGARKEKYQQDAAAWAIDYDKVREGRKHFAALCAGCHKLADQVPENKALKATFVPVGKLVEGYRFEPTSRGIGTDETMALNFQKRRYLTGAAEGWPSRYIRDSELKARDSGLRLLAFGVAGTLVGANDSGVDLADAIERGRPPGFDWRKSEDDPLAEVCTNNKSESKPQLLCYKARSLNGVWATGPFLHNGSVRTIRQVLLPEERDPIFYVGSREYNPREMGFQNDKSPSDPLSGTIDAFMFDTNLPGNSNDGHDVLPQFTRPGDDEPPTWARERRAKIALGIMEFLKTLGRLPMHRDAAISAER